MSRSSSSGWLQEQSRLSSFNRDDDNPDRIDNSRTSFPRQPAAAHTCFYEPNNAAADYAGFVGKGAAGKKTFQNPPALAESIVRTQEYGITPKEGVKSLDAFKPSRKVTNLPKHNDQFSLADQGPPETEDHWKTVYQAAISHQAPAACDGGGAHGVGKKRIVPPYAQGNTRQQPEPASEELWWQQAPSGTGPLFDAGPIQKRRPGESLLSGIGAAIVDKVGAKNKTTSSVERVRR